MNERTSNGPRSGDSKIAAVTSQCAAVFESLLREGYVLLIAVIAIGAVASIILSSLLLLGTSAGQVSHSVRRGAQAFAAAQGCAEYALLKLRESPSYSGNEMQALDAGTCEVLPIGGMGNNNRFICVEGVAGENTRRLEIVVRQILPQVRIDSYQEVADFSLCL